MESNGDLVRPEVADGLGQMDLAAVDGALGPLLELFGELVCRDAAEQPAVLPRLRLHAERRGHPLLSDRLALRQRLPHLLVVAPPKLLRVLDRPFGCPTGELPRHRIAA